MGIFPFRKKKEFFSPADNEKIVQAIRNAEMRTSGEVRVFVESRCRWVDAIDRASELFFSLKMDKTEQRNAVLVYLAMKDRQVAVYGDQGIHDKVGHAYWNKMVAEMLTGFNSDKYGEGVANCIIQIGQALQREFPYNKSTDKNELPDDIVFGR